MSMPPRMCGGQRVTPGIGLLSTLVEAGSLVQQARLAGPRASDTPHLCLLYHRRSLGIADTSPCVWLHVGSWGFKLRSRCLRDTLFTEPLPLPKTSSFGMRSLECGSKLGLPDYCTMILYSINKYSFHRLRARAHSKSQQLYLHDCHWLAV